MGIHLADGAPGLGKHGIRIAPHDRFDHNVGLRARDPSFGDKLGQGLGDSLSRDLAVPIDQLDGLVITSKAENLAGGRSDKELLEEAHARKRIDDLCPAHVDVRVVVVLSEVNKLVLVRIAHVHQDEGRIGKVLEQAPHVVGIPAEPVKGQEAVADIIARMERGKLSGSSSFSPCGLPKVEVNRSKEGATPAPLEAHLTQKSVATIA
jgi:hypothetical protein